MLPYIDLSEIGIKPIKSIKFDNHEATIVFTEGSFIEIEYDMFDGLYYHYWSEEGKYYRIDA